MRLRSSIALISLGALTALPATIEAQSRDVYLLPVPKESDLAAPTGRTQPGVAASSPVGWGPSTGDVFVGFGYQAKTTTSGSDGTVMGGFGMFSAQNIGIEAVLVSASTMRSGFGSRVLGAIKAHHTTSSGIGIGLGVEAIKLIGDGFDVDPSVYVVGTKMFPLRDAAWFSSMTVNLGVGSGRYQSAKAFLNGDKGQGVFFGTSLRLNDAMSAIYDFTGAQSNLAVSVAPLPRFPLVITPSLNDLSGAAGPKNRFAIGAGLSWKY